MRTLLQIVDQYLRDCLEDNVSPQVVELARRLGLSSWAFTRRFEQQLCCPPGQYMKSAQLDRAMALLRETSLPVEAIASECGFASARAFYRAFRRRAGTTPRAFRNMPSASRLGQNPGWRRR
jgi:transcriptional regulator GlxA family with amidase domain